MDSSSIQNNNIIANQPRFFEEKLQPVQQKLQAIYEKSNAGYAGAIETSRLAADVREIPGGSWFLSAVKVVAAVADDEQQSASPQFNEACAKLGELCQLPKTQADIAQYEQELEPFKAAGAENVGTVKKGYALTWSDLLQHQLTLESDRLELLKRYLEIAKTEQVAIELVPSGEYVESNELEDVVAQLTAEIAQQEPVVAAAKEAFEKGAAKEPESFIHNLIKSFLEEEVLSLAAEATALRPLIAKLENNEKLTAEELKDLMAGLGAAYEKTKDLKERLVSRLTKMIEDNKGYVRTGAAAAGAAAGVVVMGPLGGAVGAILAKNACDFLIGKAKPEDDIARFVDSALSGIGAIAGGGIIAGLLAAGVSAAHESNPKVEAALDVGAKAVAANAAGASASTAASIGILGTLIQGQPGLVREVASDIQSVVGKFRSKGAKAFVDVAKSTGKLFADYAVNTVKAARDRKWTELAVRVSAVVLPVISASLGLSAAGIAIVTFLLGVYLVQKYYDSRSLFEGKATLTNDQLFKAVVERAEKEQGETELDKIKAAFDFVLGRVTLDQYDVTTVGEISARLARIANVKQAIDEEAAKQQD